MPESSEVPVLIIGAGPVGLSLALLLSRFGVRSLIVERRRAVSPHPRARFVNARTMEIFRQLGIEAEVRALAIPDGLATCALWAPTLAAPEVKRVEIETLGPASGEPLSPSPGVTTSQDRLDPLLLRALGEAGMSDVRFGWRLTALRQDEHGVVATCADETAGTMTVRAMYVVAADGARSTVRELLEIPMEGPAVLGNTINIHFKADMTPVLRGRPVNLAMILNPAQPGLLLNIDGDRSWTAQAIFSPAAGQKPEDFTPDRCRAIVRMQVGVPDLAVEILGIAPWASAARVAKRFCEERVFLAGDAAQEMPPAGGFGMNIGIQEAHNLAWKLAGVIHGWSGETLLATYEPERRPTAQFVTQQALLNLTSVGRVESPEGRPPQVKLGRPEFFRERGLVFGATYHSSAVIPDGAEPPPSGDPVTDYVPSATPGARAPHLWIGVNGQKCSTLDLWGTSLTLIALGPRSAWHTDLEGRAERVGIPLRVVDTVDQSLAQVYGLEPGGAVLIRPDGHVGWRGVASAPGAAGQVFEALSQIVG
jgi:putative polyketide hydroxylase